MRNGKVCRVTIPKTNLCMFSISADHVAQSLSLGSPFIPKATCLLVNRNTRLEKMPPDADKLRLRKSSSAKDDPTESTAAERICSISKLKDSEVAIDGIIYDLEGFVHPGGDTIMMFGGNDVTVQYNMIHPYHTEKHLQKMKRVGKVTDYHAEYVHIVQLYLVSVLSLC